MNREKLPLYTPILIDGSNLWVWVYKNQALLHEQEHCTWNFTRTHKALPAIIDDVRDTQAFRISSNIAVNDSADVLPFRFSEIFKTAYSENKESYLGLRSNNS